MFNKREFVSMIDLATLKANMTMEDIKKACEEAKKYKVKLLCVNSFWVKYAVEELKDCETDVGVTIGFPLGACSTEAKVSETVYAINNGASEVDMVINIGALKSKLYDIVLEDIKQVVKVAKENKVLSKLIIETCYLEKEEMIKACELGVEAGIDFIKTSTGFGTAGANVADVITIKKTVKNRAQIKASGGIKSFSFARDIINMGVTRIGTSSAENLIKEMELKYI